MIKLIVASGVGFLLSVAILVDAYLPGGPRLPMAAVVIPFGLACVSSFAILFVINGGRLGNVPLGRLWSVLRALPLAAKVILPVLMVAAVANDLATTSGITDEVDFQRAAAGTLAWLNTASGALAFGVLRERNRDAAAASLPPVQPQSSVALPVGAKYAAAVFVVIGILLVAFTAMRDAPVFDNQRVHSDLAARFGSASWYPHLQAANLDHGGFHVYLDTKDPDILAAVCVSLTPYIDEVDRPADLYYVHQGDQVLIRSCT